MNTQANLRRGSKGKKYKKLRNVSILNVVLLVLNIFSFFWISDVNVESSQAAQTGLCMTICEIGGCTATDCDELLNPTPPEPDPDETTETVVVIPGGIVNISPTETLIGIIPPEEIARALVVGEQDQDIYQHVYEITTPGESLITNIRGIGDLSADGLAPSIPYIKDYFTFSGKTNIKNAIIILTLSSHQTFYGTTYADANGQWQWTSPSILEPNTHYINVLAISPTNASIRHEYKMSFIVEPAREVLDEEVDLPPPAPVPVPKITSDIYVINLKVILDQDFIYPGDHLNLIVDIISFNPTKEEAVFLEYEIKDTDNSQVFIGTSDVTFSSSVTIIKSLRLDATLEPGSYVATVNLKSREKNYLASTSFIIKSAEEKIQEPLFLLPGRIIIKRDQAQQGLFVSFVFLSLLLMLFLILLWQEYQRAKYDPQITGKDLVRSGDISI